jgi:5-methylcytosine-specific restriction endonuclease McrA
MGIHPDIFGPYVWASIHLICLGAPSVLDSSQKAQYKTFFNLLPSILPCRNCGKHLEGADATVDHIIPLSKGGDPASHSNLAASCRSCNSRKRDK